MLSGVIKAVEAKGIIPIFLYAEPETILKRLEENEGWRQRPTYMLAAEKSPDGKGWMANAEMHRKERLETFIKNAAIIISVDEKDENQSTVRYKSPLEIASEIFIRIKEHEYATGMKFFETVPPKKLESESIDKLRETKKWLENNLKFRM